MRILFIIGPSIQVRRQDKYRESKFIPLEVYVEHIDEYYEILQVGLTFFSKNLCSLNLHNPNFQSMTWYLFWLASLTTSQPKSLPQKQLRANCFVDGRNLQPQLYYIEVPSLEF